jgi:hypothetical protein
MARASMEVVRRMFPQHVISRFGDVSWPPRSPDLSVCDFEQRYFYVKNMRFLCSTL